MPGTSTYQGRLFLTARGAGGGLLGSTGEAEVAVRQWDPPGPGERAFLTARFAGRYGGEAGSGAVEGRVAPCAYSGASGALAGGLASESGAEVSDLEEESRSLGWNGPDGRNGGSR